MTAALLVSATLIRLLIPLHPSKELNQSSSESKPPYQGDTRVTLQSNSVGPTAAQPYISNSTLTSTMATASVSESGSGLPLEAFTRSTPPGWRPGDMKYPYRRYKQILGLWQKVTALNDAQAGPAIAAR